jgi:uncharacterized protein (TIGR03437 family)
MFFSPRAALISSTVFSIILPQAAAQLPISYRYAIYDVPGAMATELRGINDRGDVVGIYVNPDGIQRGVVRSADGSTFASVVGPDGTGGSPAINSSGQIAFDTGTNVPGFGFDFSTTMLYLRSPGQPDSVLATFSGAGVITGMNDRAQVIGYVVTKGLDIPFVLNSDGTPAAIKLNAASNYGMNNAGQVLRIHSNEFQPHDAVAFIDNADGTPSGRQLDLPHDVANAAMSNTGLIAGTFGNSVPTHSFIGDPDTNTYSLFDVPGYEGQTRVYGVNDFGVVVGTVGPATSTTTHGFIAMPVPVTPALAPGGVMNAASYYNASVSPGEVVVLFGVGLGTPALAFPTVDAARFVATDILGTRVLFDGVAAPLLSASSGAVSAVVPYEVTGAITRLQVEFSGIRSDVVTLPVTPSAPGIFSLDESGRGPGVIFNQDGSINTVLNSAKRGDIISFYATGFGQTLPAGATGRITGMNLPVVLQQPLPITVMFGNTKGLITYDGPAPAIIAGVSQVNVVVPKDAPFGATVPLTVQVGSAASQSGLTVALK